MLQSASPSWPLLAIEEAPPPHRLSRTLSEGRKYSGDIETYSDTTRDIAVALSDEERLPFLRVASWHGNETEEPTTKAIKGPGGFRRLFSLATASGKETCPVMDMHLAKKLSSPVPSSGNFFQTEDDTKSPKELKQQASPRPARVSHAKQSGTYAETTFVRHLVKGGWSNLVPLPPSQIEQLDLTEVGCFINVVRANLGPGFMSLPHAFSLTGLWLSLGLGLPLLALAMLATWVLVAAQEELVKTGRLSKHKPIFYPDMAEAVVGKIGRYMVEASVGIGQFGICAVYYSFVSTNISTVFGFLNQRTLIIAMMPVTAAMTFIRTPGKLVMLSGIGNLCIMIGVVAVVAALFPRLPEGAVALMEKPPAKWSSAIFFASNLIFSFEGIALVIPLQAAMVRKDRFPAILMAGLGTVALMYMTFAIYCMSGLGGVVTSGSISASLDGFVPQWIMDLCNLVLAAAVLVTYPLQFFPAIQVIEHYIIEAGVHPKSNCLVLSRALISLLCGMLTLQVPNISLLISFVGSLGFPIIGLVMPCWIHMKVGHPGSVLIFLEVVIIFLGIFVMVFGTISSVQSMISAFHG